LLSSGDQLINQLSGLAENFQLNRCGILDLIIDVDQIIEWIGEESWFSVFTY